jgi:RsiW-degrading membrane proteinase PrsW (M82 family)
MSWGSITWQRHRFTGRELVALGGGAFWLILMLINTGTGGIVALWTALVFMAELIALGSLTRTVSIRQLISVFMLGGFAMSLAYVFALFIPHTSARAFLVPPMEELLKIAPVLFVLWRGRNSTTRILGITDVMLLAAASGAGFGMVEDAYIRHHSGWPAQLDWLPLTEITGGRLIAGHAIWTTLAGVTLGFALLFRSRLKMAVALGASGLIWSVFDHIANNYGVGRRGLFANFLNGIAGHGWTTIYLFVIGVVAAIGFDLYMIHGQLPPFPELKLPKLQSGVNGLKTLWSFLVGRRALAYVLFRYRGASGIARAELACAGAMLDLFLVNHHQPGGATEPA